jgi:hypothetical protein
MSNLADLSGERADPAASLNQNTNQSIDPKVDLSGDLGSELGLQKDLEALSQLVGSALKSPGTLQSVTGYRAGGGLALHSRHLAADFAATHG